MSDPQIIAQIQKNKGEIIQVSLAPFNGHDLAHLRIFWLKTDTGEYLPSKKGISFRTALLPSVIEALQQASDQADQQ